MPSWAGIRESELAERADGTTAWLQRALSALSTVGLTAQRIERVLSTAGLAETVAELVPIDAARAAAEQVDFAASQAYMRSRIECGVRINLEGREPDGVVPQSEYETVREEVIEALSGVRTPDGEPVFADVAPREAYFRGPEADRAVDVVTVPADYDQFLSASLAGDWFGEPDEPWNHKFEGVFAARGSGIDEGAAVDGATLVDVAPTVLATLDIPVDERMDGDVLPVATPAGEEAYPEYDPGEPAGTDDAAVERRLSDLGYLEQP
jgi:predicted AlkP superfamily phosphohydrolase/phosphomutase